MAQLAYGLGIITSKVYTLASESGLKIDQQKFEGFLQSAINGDQAIRTHVVFGATIGKEDKGIVVYILTNVRFIRIRITAKGFNSTDFFLKQVSGVKRELLSQPAGGNDARIEVESAQGFIGLSYNASHTEISNFFSEVEGAVRQAKAA